MLCFQENATGHILSPCTDTQVFVFFTELFLLAVLYLFAIQSISLTGREMSLSTLTDSTERGDLIRQNKWNHL